MQTSGCSAEDSEPFALRVMGDSMLPEFTDGHIILVDPGLNLRHGVFAVLEYNGELLFGQYRREGEQQWLHYLNPAHQSVLLHTSYEVKGVVTQRATGRRKDIKHYEYPAA